MLNWHLCSEKHAHGHRDHKLSLGFPRQAPTHGMEQHNHKLSSITTHVFAMERTGACCTTSKRWNMSLAASTAAEWNTVVELRRTASMSSSRLTGVSTGETARGQVKLRVKHTMKGRVWNGSNCVKPSCNTLSPASSLKQSNCVEVHRSFSLDWQRLCQALIAHSLPSLQPQRGQLCDGPPKLPNWLAVKAS